MTKQNEVELSAITRQILHMGGLVELALDRSRSREMGGPGLGPAIDQHVMPAH